MEPSAISPRRGTLEDPEVIEVYLGHHKGDKNAPKPMKAHGAALNGHITKAYSSPGPV